MTKRSNIIYMITLSILLMVYLLLPRVYIVAGKDLFVTISYALKFIRSPLALTTFYIGYQQTYNNRLVSVPVHYLVIGLFVGYTLSQMLLLVLVSVL